MNPKILVVEDETEIRELMVLHLKRQGYFVHSCSTGAQALEMLNEEDFDLVVLDWMMPELSGPEFTEIVRRQPKTAALPILFVTARAEPQDIAYGLEKGADDYVTKPFDLTVLMARVKALLRRRSWVQEMSGKSKMATNLQLGPLALDTERFEAQLDGATLELTRSEFLLLQAMLLNQGKVLSRNQLIKEIQGEGVNVVGRTVDTHIFGLRKKLGSFSDSIETIRGVGYRVNYRSDVNLESQPTAART